MKWLFGRGRADLLKGTWVVDPTDAVALGEFGQVELEFDSGRLTYAVILADKKQLMLLTYRVEGDVLITDQPSHPQSERTKFQIEEDRLTLSFGGTTGRFLRV